MMKKYKKKPVFPDTAWGKLRAFWYFVWNDDSALSWVLSIIIAFVIIKFVIYPILGFTLATTHPVVAVVSGSMEHKFASENGVPELCGTSGGKGSVDFNEFWSVCGPWYEDVGITKSQFSKFHFTRGMNTGDIIVLHGSKEVDVGDVIVFRQTRQPQPNPIIHRVVAEENVNGTIYYQTKGDHNPGSALYEFDITQEQVLGKSIFRIPWLGFVKIWAVNLVGLF